MDDHLHDAPLDAGDELCAPCDLVGAVRRHGPDDRLDGARLPKNEAVRDKKGTQMARCRLARGARCAAASDELRRHAAAARRSRQLQQHFAVLPSECRLQLRAPCAHQCSSGAFPRRMALEAGREESKGLNRDKKKRTAMRPAFLMQICLTSCSFPARQA